MKERALASLFRSPRTPLKRRDAAADTYKYIAPPVPLYRVSPISKCALCIIHFLFRYPEPGTEQILFICCRMVRIVAEEFLTDERDRKYYADHYTCCPPPLFIIIITLIEVRISCERVLPDGTTHV